MVNSGFDPGCVKSRNKITRASQKNRTRRSGEFKMRLVERNHISVERQSPVHALCSNNLLDTGIALAFD
jgi:hypothetical protein